MVQDFRSMIARVVSGPVRAGGSVYRERHVDLRYPPIGKGMAASKVQGSWRIRDARV